MEKGMNRNITDSFTLRDALIGFAGIGGTDEQIAHEFARFFIKNPDVRQPFEKAFREMMQDTAHTSSEKYEYFIEGADLPEEQARHRLEEIWQLATGTEWQGEGASRPPDGR